jgi:murein DD-endopeptidase MepM/ murein hydrolase activator NlpD
MGNKKFTRILAVILAFLMLLSVAMIAISALAGTAASARVTQGQIDRLREERREYERQRREIEGRINTIEFERMTEIARKEVLDDRIALTGMEIENIRQSIYQFNRLIREMEYEVIVAQNRENEQLQRFRNRVRDMEENGIISYLDIIFGSTSFADLLARIDFVSDIMRADENSYNALQEARAETEAAKEALEETRAELYDEERKLEDKVDELEEQLEYANQLIIRMNEDLDSQRELQAHVRAEEDRILREINAAEAELARQQELERQRRAREAAARAGGGGGGGGGGGSVVGTGELLWPTAGRVTSPFGVRRHPVFGDMRRHSGIDIGAPHGQPIVAADSGTVITSTFNSSYGNFIVISHGNGVSTLYAHLSTRQVSVGDTVSRGQQIGLVGSTGVSTGPHLHFEVIVNGTRVNPMTRF